MNVTVSALALVAGVAIGAGGISVLQAQGTKKPAYVVAEVEVTDQPAYQAYAAKATDAVKAANGRVLAVSNAETKEGPPLQGRLVVLSFDSLAAAEKWYDEPPYHPLIAERQKAAKTRLATVAVVPTGFAPIL
jgi:uncharacterized protein (DUF1330 family)